MAMIDEASDPQANVAELLISAGYGAPAPVTTSSDQTTVAAEPHGKECLELILTYILQFFITYKEQSVTSALYDAF